MTRPIARVVKRAPTITDRWSECGRICAIVAADFGVPVSALLSDKRDQVVARPRMVAMYLAHRCTTFSLSRIGRAFQRDHTTVMHAVNGIEARMRHDWDLRVQVNRCEASVRDPSAMAAEKIVISAGERVREQIESLAEEAFGLDPIGAAQVVRDALAAFIDIQRTTSTERGQDGEEGKAA